MLAPSFLALSTRSSTIPSWRAEMTGPIIEFFSNGEPMREAMEVHLAVRAVRKEKKMEDWMRMRVPVRKGKA